MDPASSYNAVTNRSESNSERLTRLRAFTTYAEELMAYYFWNFCMLVQKQQEYHDDWTRLRGEVLPSIGDDCYEDDMRYNAVVATHNELVAKFRALLPQTGYYLNAFLKLKPVVAACRRELDFAAENE